MTEPRKVSIYQTPEDMARVERIRAMWREMVPLADELNHSEMMRMGLRLLELELARDRLSNQPGMYVNHTLLEREEE